MTKFTKIVRKILKASFFSLYIFKIIQCVCMWRSKSSDSSVQFSPSTMWVLGIKLRSADVAAFQWLSHLTGPGIFFIILDFNRYKHHLHSSHLIHQVLSQSYSNASGLTPGQADCPNILWYKWDSTEHRQQHRAACSTVCCAGLLVSQSFLKARCVLFQENTGSPLTLGEWL